MKNGFANNILQHVLRLSNVLHLKIYEVNIEDQPIFSSFEEFYHGNRFHLTVDLHNHTSPFLN